jgi:hypothetical protein
LLHWNPHIHSLVSCGAFTPDGDFLELSEFDRDSLLVAWQESVFDLYLSEGKIEPEVMENMRSWEHSGFSVDQSVLLAAGDRSGIERLVQYMVRCPFSLSRLVKVTDTGQVAYKAEKDACQVFPDPQADNLEAGAKRNFQILSQLDFLAPRLPETGHATHSAQRFSYNSIFWFLFEQVAWHAQEGRSGSISRAIKRRDGSDWQQPGLGDVDQADLRSGPIVLSRVWRPDEGCGVHRATSDGRDRRDPAALRIMAFVVSAGTT